MKLVGLTYTTVLILLLTRVSFGQTGEVLETGSSVLDPNGDGFISTTSAGFSADGYDVDEFEIPMFGIPIFGSGEALGDTQSGGDCGVTDLALDSAGYAIYAAFDANENLIFRFRAADNSSAVQSYSILIDTDQLVGADDPNATSQNPGFEIAITLIQKFGVYIYDIDGIESCPTELAYYSDETHQQKATSALVSCETTDIYFDFYVPFSDLTTFFGITPDSDLRFVGVTNISATCALDGSISDIGGVDDEEYGGCFSCAILDLTVNQCPSPISGLCDTCEGFPLGYTASPEIDLPVSAGDVSIRGTGQPESEIYIEVYNDLGVLQDQDTTLTGLDSLWQSNNFDNQLQNGDSVVVIAYLPGYCASGSTATDIDYIIVSPNYPPQLDASLTSVNYTEADPPVIISDDITISDDNPDITSATVTITGNYESGADFLSASPPAGISFSFSAVDGELTFTGIASLADYDSALRSVTFVNTASPPSLDVRVVNFVVNDGLYDSQPIAIYIIVSELNAAPVISGTATALVYTEGDGAVLLDNAITVTDAENDDIVSATVTFTQNFTEGEDTLYFTDQNGIIGSFNNQMLTLIGTATLADYQAALRSITYENTSIAPNTSIRTVEFIVYDGFNASLPFSREITIIPIIEPPVITVPGIGDVFSLSYTEGDGAVPLLPDFLVTDPDDINLEGVTVTFDVNYVIKEDVLAFTDQLGISGIFDIPAGVLSLTGTASLVDYTTAISAITYENISENPGTLTRELSLVVSDGDDISNVITITVDVIPVNDAPMVDGTETPLIYHESSGPVSIDSLIIPSDYDDTHLDSAIITIVNNYQMSEDILGFTNQANIIGQFDEVMGILTLVGSATIEDYQAALRSVTYENTEVMANLSTRLVEVIVSDGELWSTPFAREIELKEVIDPVIPYQLVTPDNDGYNDTWIIDGIEQYPDNIVRIFDRWNKLVYQQESYVNDANGWAGVANHGMASGDLPDGTYFYVIHLGDGSDLYEGFLILKRK